jgi:hypothetical protein
MDNLDLGKKMDLMKNDFDLVEKSKQVLVGTSNLFSKSLQWQDKIEKTRHTRCVN